MGTIPKPEQDSMGKIAIEKMHTQFIKRILGLNRSTTNILARGELGRYPLQA